METKIKINEGISVERKEELLVFKKNGIINEKNIFHPLVDINIGNNEIILTSKKENRSVKKLMNTFSSHIINLLKGLETPFVYKLKICSSHFPMTVKLEGKIITISNFVGEKVPRKARIVGTPEVKIEKDIITVTSSNIEHAGLTAGALENSTRITKRDRRIFQDGIFIINKPGMKRK